MRKEVDFGKEDLEMVARYISPFTDFGFKKLFGEEGNKPITR